MDILCDLVLLSWNHLEETQPCLESLFQSTDVPSRLIIVDNGSDPAVRAFLASVAPRGAIQEVKLLQNETNEGFPRGMNRGIQTSSAPFVCLLNNDLRFTTGWLREMIEVAQASPSVGLINPASNTFGHRPPAGVPFREYLEALHQRYGETSEVGMCIGFCLLVKREVLNQIGGLSEEVERIFFEDEDFSMRAQEAGYRCIVAEGAYVHHAEHQTMRVGPERQALFERNQRWCNERWGRRIRVAWPRFASLAPGSDDLRHWLERLLRWARRRTHVYVYCPLPNGMTVRDVFRSVGLEPHSDIHWFNIPRAIAPVASVRAIISRQKKPFDLIVAPEVRWAALVGGLRWLHHADVVSEAHEDQLTVLWKQKSRSPSSS